MLFSSGLLGTRVCWLCDHIDFSEGNGVCKKGVDLSHLYIGDKTVPDAATKQAKECEHYELWLNMMIAEEQ